jgi:hypothetical protein
MPTYCTEFSCHLDVGSSENAAIAVSYHNEQSVLLDGERRGYNFSLDILRDQTFRTLWIHSEECAEPRDVEQFVLRCAREFKLKGLWSFSWAFTCTRPLLDAFGGGAAILDLEKGKVIDHIDTACYIDEIIENYDIDE